MGTWFGCTQFLVHLATWFQWPCKTILYSIGLHLVVFWNLRTFQKSSLWVGETFQMEHVCNFGNAPATYALCRTYGGTVGNRPARVLSQAYPHFPFDWFHTTRFKTIQMDIDCTIVEQMVQVRLYTFPCYFWSTESTKWRWTHMLRNIRMDHFHAEPLMEPMTLVQDNTSSVLSGTDLETLASESDVNLWHAETNVEKLAEFLVSSGKCKIVTVVVLLLRALVVAVAIRHIKHARLYMLTFF